MENFSRDKNVVEILCIGTELLLGNILNSNARWLAEELAALGTPHYLQVVVGDNSLRVIEAVKEASKRSRILITTGGLGPTPDDLTTEAIAKAFNTPLQERRELLVDIESKVNLIGEHSVLSNRKQALLPLGANILPNPTGTAAGMVWSPQPDFTIMTFPGVPSELKEMWAQSALPWLKKNLEISHTFLSKTLRFTGIGEATLSEDIKDLLSYKNPTLAPYAGIGEVKIRITARARTIKEAETLIEPIENELHLRTGLKLYASNEENLASVLLGILRHRNQTLSVAESCTGGALGAELTKVSGASDVFIGGVVAYSNSIKENLLGVSQKLLQKHGAVSKEVAEAMALGVRKEFETDWSIAITGLAGPGGGSETKPVGLVHIAIAGPNFCNSRAEIFPPSKGRIYVQTLSVIRGLDRLRLLLLAKS